MYGCRSRKSILVYFRQSIPKPRLYNNFILTPKYRK
uniref:Uncharacterized protein n=1 Tax=Anguilla anguilla TaxID=7936 RepID=A0A0E9UCR7_ANGAN